MTSKNMQLSTIDSRGQFAETAFGKHKRRAGVIRPPYRVTFVDRFVRIRNVQKRSGVSHFSQQTREMGHSPSNVQRALPARCGRPLRSLWANNHLAKHPKPAVRPDLFFENPAVRYHTRL